MCKANQRDRELTLLDTTSTDGSRIMSEGYQDRNEYCEIYAGSKFVHRGSIRTPDPHASWKVIVAQDADLEYDPICLPPRVAPVARGEAEVIFGSRHLKRDNPRAMVAFFMASITLNRLTGRMYWIGITVFATFYTLMKIIPLLINR